MIKGILLLRTFSSELYIISSIGANSSPNNANAATEYWLNDFFVLLTKSEEAVAATEAAAIATAMAVSLSTRSGIQNIINKGMTQKSAFITMTTPKK